MLQRNFILGFLIAAHCLGQLWGIRCEDDYAENNLYGSRNVLQELQEIKHILKKLNIRQTIPPTEDKYLPMFDERYETLPEICEMQRLPRNCGEATACTGRSGYYHIQINDFSNDSFLVECDDHTEGGDWTVIQRRHDGSEDFFRTWSDYKQGFGNINSEYFIGLDKLYALTNFDGPQELLILMTNDTNYKVQVRYDTFIIGSESEKYKLKSLGRYFGVTHDDLRRHMGMEFATKDQDNNSKCANDRMGAWWYADCHNSNLNGKYGNNLFGKGIQWHAITGYESSLKYVKMMIRRRRSHQ